MADSYQVHLPYTHLLFHDDNSDPEHLYTLRADVWRRSIRPSLGTIAYKGPPGTLQQLVDQFMSIVREVRQLDCFHLFQKSE